MPIKHRAVEERRSGNFQPVVVAIPVLAYKVGSRQSVYGRTNWRRTVVAINCNVGLNYGTSGIFLLAVSKLISIFLTTCFGLLLSATASTSADNSDAQVRVFEINGTKLYVPVSWEVTNYRPLEGGLHGLRPGEPVPSKFASPTKLTSMTITFCLPMKIVGSDPQKSQWELKRSFVPKEMPSEWCIGTVALDYGPKDLAAHPRLGVDGYPSNQLAKFGPVNEWGFRFYQAPDGPPGAGAYVGVLPTDVSRIGGPIHIEIQQTIQKSQFFVARAWGGSALALDGVTARLFDWYVTSIKPDELRKYFWRCQAVLDWLATEPTKRSEKIVDPE